MKLRALLFEDDADTRRMLRTVLERRGYEVMDYPNPAKCPLQRIHACHCDSKTRCADIVVSDVDMPRISGLDFIRSQKEKGCRVTHIGLISGAWSRENLANAKQMGCRTFHKPFSIAAFTSWLNTAEKEMKADRNLSDWFREQASPAHG